MKKFDSKTEEFRYLQLFKDIQSLYNKGFKKQAKRLNMLCERLLTKINEYKDFDSEEFKVILSSLKNLKLDQDLVDHKIKKIKKTQTANYRKYKSINSEIGKENLPKQFQDLLNEYDKEVLNILNNIKSIYFNS